MIDFDSAYVSGGMRNKAFFNFPMFDAVRDYLMGQGLDRVHSPADNDRRVWPECELAPGFRSGTYSPGQAPPGYSFRELFVWDVWAIGDADAIVLLPGWEASEGAALELHVAKSFGKKVRYAVMQDAGLDAEGYPLWNVLGIVAEDPFAVVPPEVRAELINEIIAERARQDAKWGWIGENEASILPGTNEHAKVSVLGEEFGEVAKAVLEVEVGLDTDEHLEEELVQVAAVALAWLEARRQRALMVNV